LYSQQFFKATFESPLSRKTRIEASYEIMSLLYADESDLDLLRNSVSFGIEHSLNSKVTVSTGLNLDAVNYVNYGHDDYYEPDVFVKVRQSLPDKFYHSLAYDLAYQTYPTWLTATVEGPESDEKRADFRNTFLYEVGKYFEKDLAKVYFEFFRNTSNVRFLDYYNYQSYKLGSSLTHIFNDKIMGYLSGYWQCRPFSGRTLINDAGRHERDYTYVLSAAGYYTLNRSTTVGLSYAYRQNNSNEPTEKYSGSLISATAYYRF
jgi:hypothetical protein